MPSHRKRDQSDPRQLKLGLGAMPDTTKLLDPVKEDHQTPRWFNPSTATGAQRTHIAKGLHPTGAALGKGTCGTCSHMMNGYCTAPVFGRTTHVMKSWQGCEHRLA